MDISVLKRMAIFAPFSIYAFSLHVGAGASCLTV